MWLIRQLPGEEMFACRRGEAGGWELGAIEPWRLPYGEFYVRIVWDVVDRQVDFVSTTGRPDDVFLRRAFTADAADALGASEVILVAPYVASTRWDRRLRRGLG